MPINTKNSGSLVGSGAEKGATRRVTFLKQTYVTSLGRNSAVGETQAVSDTDARFLIAYKYAKKAEEPAPEASATGIIFTGADDKESSSSSSEAQAAGITFTGVDLVSEDVETEAVAEGEEPERQFPGRRRRRG